MAVKNPPAALFLFQVVRIETMLVDPSQSDEKGDAYYSFVGVLLDVDDKYITLGYEQDEELIPSTAIRHEDVRLIQVYNGDASSHKVDTTNKSVN